MILVVFDAEVSSHAIIASELPIITLTELSAVLLRRFAHASTIVLVGKFKTLVSKEVLKTPAA